MCFMVADRKYWINGKRSNWPLWQCAGKCTTIIRQDTHPDELMCLLNQAASCPKGFDDVHALHPGARTTRPDRQHKIYPYLLRNLVIDRVNQVWCADITYIPMRKGFLYLVTVMDWHSRKVLSWCLSNSLDTAPCIEALEEALVNHGAPAIFNTDQGCQFTSDGLIDVLKNHWIQISMDGKDRWIDKVFSSASGAA